MAAFVPGKDALAIAKKQPFRRQIAANGEEPVGLG
jgi:hypothetical protein